MQSTEAESDELSHAHPEMCEKKCVCVWGCIAFPKMYFWYSDINRATLGMMLKWTRWQSAPLLYQTVRERLAGGKEGEGYKVRETADRGVLGWAEWKICGDREQYGRRWLRKMDRKRWETEERGGWFRDSRREWERNRAEKQWQGEEKLRSGNSIEEVSPSRVSQWDAIKHSLILPTVTA